MARICTLQSVAGQSWVRAAQVACLGVLLAASSGWGQQVPPLTGNEDPARGKPVDLRQESLRQENRIQLEGTVIEQQKYRFTVLVDDQQHVVRLAPDAVVGLRMHKPWFDWGAGKVYVIPRPDGADDDSADTSNAAEPSGDEKSDPQRIAINLPMGPLFLISRFRNTSQMQRIMAAPEKRINFYLISPENPGDHAPTETEPYISGRLVHDQEQPLMLKIGTDAHRIRLGFQTATFNGFTIADLVPEKTFVTLTGDRDPKTGEVSAASIVFEPLHK